MAKEVKKVTIELTHGQAEVKINGIDNFSEMLICLATLEGVVGGIMDTDKALIRTAVDEIQNDLQAKLPEDVK